MTYVVAQVPEDSGVGFAPYGGARKMWSDKSNEVMLSGPAETGKTRPCLEKLHAVCNKYEGARALMCRRTYKSIKDSAVVTFEKKVLGAWDRERKELNPDRTHVRKYGGVNVQHYSYPNGSQIVVGGLDRADKVLSAEYDFIYVNQAEEISLADWEKLLTRATGRAGNVPWAQVLGDCNPAHPKHWILKRSTNGPLTKYESRHEDNPTLFDPVTGAITEQGRTTMRILDNLTGTRYLRLRKGLWVQAEGVVYPEYDERNHLIDRTSTINGLTGDPDDPIPADWRRIRVVDFGYTNPFVCHWIAIDPDGRMYLYREIYMTGRTVAQHAQTIKQESEGEKIEITICDHDAEDRATLDREGIPNVGAYKAVSRGIEAVKDRLQEAGDGKPRIYFLRDSLVEIDPELQRERKPVRTTDEFGSYMWKDSAQKDEPQKEDDHGMDTMRYGVAYVDQLGSGGGFRVTRLG